VGVEIGIEGADVPPVDLLLVGFDPRDLVGGEVVAKRR